MSSGAVASSPQVLPKWKVSDAIVVGLVLLLAMSAAIWLNIRRWPQFPLRIHPTAFQGREFAVATVQVFTLAIVAIVVVTLAKHRKLGDPLSSIGWNPTRIGASAVMGVALSGAVTVVLKLAYASTPILLNGFAPLSILLFFLADVFVGPFVEECYFRGILFVALSEKLGEFASLIPITLLFALFHPAYRLFAVFLLVGFVLGVARIKTKSVAACFVLHATYNIGLLVSQHLLIR